MKVALVTGGSSGIGYACCLEFLKLDYKVICLDINQPEQQENLYYYNCDLSNHKNIKQTISQIILDHNRIDTVINNVGIHPPEKNIFDQDIEQFINLVNINLTSTYAVCSYTFKELIKTKGTIVNISSMVALIGQNLATDYCATKAGQLGLTKSLAIEAAKYGIRVNAVCPSNVLTPTMTKWINTFDNPTRKYIEMSQVQKLGKMAQPVDIAKIVVFLATSGSSFVTGQIIQADGGACLDYSTRNGFTEQRSPVSKI